MREFGLCRSQRAFSLTSRMFRQALNHCREYLLSLNSRQSGAETKMDAHAEG